MKKNDHEGCERAFVWSSKAWYAKSLPHEGEEIMFGMYARDGGTSGEMGMRWHDLGNERVPRLEVFSDAWSALSLFPDLIKILGDNDSNHFTPREFVEILKSCGFADFTEYTDPHGKTNKEYLLSELQAAESKVRDLRAKLYGA